MIQEETQNQEGKGLQMVVVKSKGTTDLTVLMGGH